MVNQVKVEAFRRAVIGARKNARHLLPFIADNQVDEFLSAMNVLNLLEDMVDDVLAMNAADCDSVGTSVIDELEEYERKRYPRNGKENNEVDGASLGIIPDLGRVKQT